MAWILVFAAGLVEVGFAFALKESHGFTRPLPSLAVFLVGGLSLFLLSVALRTLPVGPAYAMWTGIGAAGTMLAGIVILGESASIAKLASGAAIIAGVLGLRLTGGE